MCVLCFLDNLYQYNIRENVQSRSDRFEHSLLNYKFSFIHYFEESLSKELCIKHNCPSNIYIYNFLKNLDIESISDFFEELKKSYLLWIDAQPSKSLRTLANILNKYDVLTVTSKLDYQIFYRGRISNDFLSHWDMFHIPFNRRFLISNQRYSLVGQPLLYLSTSPYSIVKELNYEFKNEENLQISSFRFCNVKEESKCICFDNTNHFYEIITDATKPVNKKIPLVEESNKTLEKYFFQFILSCCCSFKRVSDYKWNFCEEYVLPQLLAQLVKQKKYSGIIFTSTKAYNNSKLCEFPILYNYLFKNVCLFTNYNLRKSDDVTFVYDKKLYKKFKISATMLYQNKFFSIEYNKYLINLLKKIIILLKNPNISTYNSFILQEISFFIIEFNKLNIDCLDEILKSSIYLHFRLIENIILDINDNLLKSRLLKEGHKC